MNLKNKKVLITGATGGIGNSLVEKFNSLGAIVVASGTNEEKLNNLQKQFSNIYIEQFKLDQHDKIEKFIEKIDQKLERKPNESIKLIKYVDDRLGHDKRYAIDSSKIKNELGWEPKYTFDRGIDKTIDWYVNKLT